MIERKLNKMQKDHTKSILIGEEGMQSSIRSLRIKIQIKDKILWILDKHKHISKGVLNDSIWIKTESSGMDKSTVDNICSILKSYTWWSDSGSRETIMFGYSESYQYLKLTIPKSCYSDPDLHTILKNILK